MSQHFPILIVLLPLTAALLSPFFSYFHRQAAQRSNSHPFAGLSMEITEERA